MNDFLIVRNSLPHVRIEISNIHKRRESSVSSHIHTPSLSVDQVVQIKEMLNTIYVWKSSSVQVWKWQAGTPEAVVPTLTQGGGVVWMVWSMKWKTA